MDSALEENMHQCGCVDQQWAGADRHCEPHPHMEGVLVFVGLEQNKDSLESGEYLRFWIAGALSS